MISMVAGRVIEGAREYRAGLALVAVIAALGWLMEPAPSSKDPQADFIASLHSAYVQSGPCGETRVPPSR